MEKFPFSNQGFQDLQAVLYVLPDAQLKLEATAVNLNFINWMDNHFELAAAQISFLQNLDERAITFIAFETSFAVGNRLPITLHKEDPPTDEEIDKIIWPKSTLSAKAGTTINFEASGTLEIHITYTT